MASTFVRKLRVAITPRSFLLRSRLQNGAIVAGYNRSGYGGRGAYIWRDSLEPELAALSSFVKPGMCFIDIGANIGVYSMKAAKEVGEKGLVIAIEPFIESAHQLAANARTNGLQNLRLRMCCVGETTGHASLYLNEGKPNSFGLIQTGIASSLSVFCVSLDNLCDWEQINRLDYLKIDAEGAEEKILEGARRSIERFRPIIQLEVTMGCTACPERYLRFAAAKSPNKVFIPVENESALLTARKLDWREA
jgi:FkbM family methyltransferase